jgi:hypothetical protein
MMEFSPELVVYAYATLSDQDFMMDTSFPSSSSSSSSSSCCSDAQSAPPDLGALLELICDEYNFFVHESGRVVPPEWTMPELVQTILGDEALQHDTLTAAYDDVMLCGTRSWKCEELLNLLDTINYAL